MNRLSIGLGAAACLAYAGAACAANGSIASSMARDFWLAAKKNEARAAQAALQARTRIAASDPQLTRPPGDSPRRVR